MKSSVLRAVFSGRRVLVTGDTGFKGSWLAWWLQQMGARVSGLALPPRYKQGPFVRASLADAIDHVDGDIRDPEVARRVVQRVRPEFVFHLAAQPLVRESYECPVDTLATNVMGSVHVLDAIRCAGRPCAVVMVTSDKCYENREWVYSYRENDAMGGHDVYSASKGCAELAIAAYRRSFFAAKDEVHVATARAGNVIGPGDWSRDRLVPDAIAALNARRALLVRNPSAVRPWQHVLEPLAGYLWLGASLARRGARFAEAWNFGPSPESVRTVAELAQSVVKAWGRGRWKVVKQKSAPHEANVLMLSIDKTAARLGWRPVWPFATAAARTVRGYRALLAAKNPREVRAWMTEEIELYADDARAAGNAWAEKG
jgi:CDP-glucose 4,6-dehydratase